MNLRSFGNYDTDAASDETALRCEDVSLTKQSFKEECDINTIIERFGIGYEMPEGVRAPVYDDFTNVHDFQSAMNSLASAREAFDALPAGVRAEFHNDPHEFVGFASNPDNFDRLDQLGMILPDASARRKAERQAAADKVRLEADAAAVAAYKASLQAVNS